MLEWKFLKLAMKIRQSTIFDVFNLDETLWFS